MRLWAVGPRVCGKCGYTSKGLTKLKCPECGSDFRHVGLGAPERRLRWFTTLLVACWLFAAGVAVLSLERSMTSALPQITTTKVETTFTGPRSGLYQYLDLRGIIISRSGWVRGTSEVIQLKWTAEIPGPRNTIRIRIVGSDDDTIIEAPSAGFKRRLSDCESNEVSRALAEFWRVDESQVEAESAQLCDVLNSWRIGDAVGWSRHMAPISERGFAGQSGGSRGSSVHPDQRSLIAIYFISAILWLGGAVAILIRGRRRLRHFSAQG